MLFYVVRVKCLLNHEELHYFLRKGDYPSLFLNNDFLIYSLKASFLYYMHCITESCAPLMGEADDDKSCTS